MRYTARIKDAFSLSFDLHQEQCRKGSGIPYITHPIAVASLVGQAGGDEDQFITALLHDAVEDQGGMPVLARIRAQFGDRVAEWVLGCSDSTELPKPPWRARKEHHIAAIRRAVPELKLIVACDKLHNAQCILADLRVMGLTAWDRFTAGREGSLWYYDQMREALADGWAHPVLEDLACLTAQLRELSPG